MRKVFTLFAAMALAGCTTYLVHPTKTDQEFYADDAQCSATAGQAVTGIEHGWGQLAVRTDVYESCMMGKGWRKE